MARKALLIGSQTEGLTGVGNDVAAMSRVLDLWGFASSPCEAENASRAGILDAYERLIADANQDDAVVVYYSGHGGYSEGPDDRTLAPARRTIQFIVPTDYHASTENDFRGITAVELSLLLARLTEKTKNVTVVLDCCHAAHMSREREMTAKALSRKVSYRLVANHMDNLRRRGQRLDLWVPPGNPHAVRVVACAPEQSAYEYDNRDGVRTGMLTEAVAQALTEAKATDRPVSWSTVIDRVRQRVLTTKPSQRPDAEGPAQRLLFDVVEADPVATLPATMTADRIRIGGAPLFGVRPGDTFAIMSGDDDDPGVPGTDRKFGDVCVDHVDSSAAWGELRPTSPTRTVPVGARAHLVSTAAPALPVRVARADPRVGDLVRAIEAAPLVRLAEPDEECRVHVDVGDMGGLTVRDEVGPLHPPRLADPAGVGLVVRDLTRLARAHALRCLAEDLEHTLPGPVSVEFGLVEDGRARPLSSSGAVLHVGHSIHVRVRNGGKDRIYVSLLDIGVAARISVLNPTSPGGVRLRKGEEYVFGRNDLTGALDGVTLSWPEDLLGGRPRPETIVVLASSEPVDTRVLEQRGVRAKGRQAGSKLEQCLDQLSTGNPRDVSPAPGPGVRFTVRTIDFDLVPAPAPAVEVDSFQVDDRPDPATLLWGPKSVAPTHVALRLSDLVVHHNRAFRGSDIRLDAVVITGGSQENPVYHARTERFSDISDGQRLPLDNLLVYHGPAVDYLDIAVWVSRDSRGSLELSDLLQESLTSKEVQAALAQVGGLLAAAPQVATAVSAVGAGAVVVNAAYRLLRRTFGDSIGLYRTTLLAHEQFGVGRPAEQDVVRAQDFSFRYLVEEVSPRVTSAVRQ
jgi:hypothetical protein